MVGVTALNCEGRGKNITYAMKEVTTPVMQKEWLIAGRQDICIEEESGSGGA